MNLGRARTAQILAWRFQLADQLADAILDAALGKYPDSAYAKLYGMVN